MIGNSLCETMICSVIPVASYMYTRAVLCINFLNLHLSSTLVISNNIGIVGLFSNLLGAQACMLGKISSAVPVTKPTLHTCL